jgi:hypothetical protein
MVRKIPILAIAGTLLLLPSRLLAGGPPWLCLPIDGVTATNAEACVDLINSKLKNKLQLHSGPYGGGAALRQDGNQRYLTFYMVEDVGLGEIDAALQGSAFSIPRDELRLFGHVILEVEPRTAPSMELLAALNAVEHTAVVDSASKENRLLVTVQMPYPVVEERPKPEYVAWDKFAWNDYTSQIPKQAESPVSRDRLPTLGKIRDVVTKYNASLKDIRWSTTHACRALGCVSVPQPDATVAATSEPAIAQ